MAHRDRAHEDLWMLLLYLIFVPLGLRYFPDLLDMLLGVK
jgi:hypothetical protein